MKYKDIPVRAGKDISMNDAPELDVHHFLGISACIAGGILLGFSPPPFMVQEPHEIVAAAIAHAIMGGTVYHPEFPELVVAELERLIEAEPPMPSPEDIIREKLALFFGGPMPGEKREHP